MQSAESTSATSVPAAHLLALLLPKFRDKEENIMTLALSHVLRQHESLKKDFVDWIFSKVSLEPPQRVRIRPQFNKDVKQVDTGSQQVRIQPDIWFFDDENADEAPVLLVENKFYAGLTAAQPKEYIQALARNRPAGLVFVAPRARIPKLVSECCKPYGCTASIADDHFFVEGKFVYFLSWEDLISYLYEVAPKGEDPKNGSYISDISQLEGIREKMEGERIKDFTEDELRQLKLLGDRINDLNQLLNRVLKDAALSKFRPIITTSNVQAGISLTICEKEFWLVADLKSAREDCSGSPFWLRIGFDSTWSSNKNTPWPKREQIRLAMEHTVREHTGGYVRDFPRDNFSMPLPFAAEKNEKDLIKDIVETILKLDRKLKNSLSALAQ